MFLCLTTALLLRYGQCRDAEALVRELQAKQAHKATLQQDPDLLKQVQDALRELNSLWTVYFPQYMDNLMLTDEGNSSDSLSPECNNSAVAILRNHYRENVTLPEVVTLLDAMGKQGAGLLEGNINLDGAFDQCFEQNYTGFCLGKLHLAALPPDGQPIWNLGICVPKHCTPHDVSLVINSTDIFMVSTHEMSCTDSERPEYGTGAIVMLVVSSVFVLLVLIGTSVDKVPELLTFATALIYERDYVKINNNSGTVGSGSIDEKSPILTRPRARAPAKRVMCMGYFKEFLTAFSLYKTVPTLLATKQPPGVITSLNGLRVMSMFWVMLGHVVQFSMAIVDNPLSLEKYLPRFTFQVIGNGYFSVDSFFFLSAVLVAYLSLRHMKKKKGRFPWIHYYVHRYLRLTPVYAFVMFFAWHLTSHFTRGPGFQLHDTTLDLYANCPKYWWTNLLYINNLYPWKLGEECFMWTWYLANDMQFYIIAPLILVPLYYLAPVGAIVALAVLMSGFVTTATLAGVYDFQSSVWASAFAYHYVPKTNLTTDDVLYIKPWTRISPYVVGLILGFLLYKNIRLSFGRLKNLTLYLSFWISSGVLLVTSVYGLYFHFHGHVPTKAENVIYLTLSRFAWGLGLALLVFVCHNGYGGLVNAFLSMKFWIPLSRMTFTAYLVHPVVLFVMYSQLQTTIHFTDITIGIFIVSLAVFSYSIAAVLCVFVEFPLGSVEMLLFKLVGLGGRESQRRANVTAQEPEKESVGRDLEKDSSKVVL